MDRGVRGRVAAAAVLLALAGPGPARAGDDGPAPAPTRESIRREVDAAIDRGVDWLRRLQLPDGGWDVRPIRMFHVPADGSLGPTALALYTLRSCGVPADDPAVRRGFQRLREIHASRRRSPKGLDTYGVSLALLALEAHHAVPGVPPPTGGTDPGPAPPSRRIPEEDLSWIRELAAWLGGAQRDDGAFSYWSPARGPAWDNSNVQIALLGLQAARRCGVPIPRSCWKRAAEHLLRDQEAKGPATARFEPEPPANPDGSRPSRAAPAKDQARGWGYARGAPATGSMTAGGVSSLVICRSELLGTASWSDAEDRRAERAVLDGLAWMGLHFSVRSNPGPAGAPALMHLWQYYWLYGLERAGVLAGVVFVGAHDWYLEGARYLLGVQRDDGSWIGEAALAAGAREEGVGPDAPTANLLDTCFALLFLKRATPKVDRGGVATPSADAGITLEGADDLDAAAFGDLFEAVFDRFRATADPARAGRAPDFVRLGTRSLPLLLRRLESDREEDRAAAASALAIVTGTARGFDPLAPEAERAAAVSAWEAWWMAARERLVPDPAAGRFRERP
jgi:hypothetical protein